jgi:predicted DNA-binding transcriptional regulator AlpA
MTRAIVRNVVEPRGLSRDDAATYIGVGASLFDRLVDDGRMPKGARLDGRIIWDRRQLDRALDRLFDAAEPNDPFSRVA